MKKLEGKAALVTGAARGIGAAIARKLAEEGATVVASDIDAEELEVVVGGISRDGGRASAFAGDVTADDFGERAVAHVVAEAGTLDILVNNAGYIWNSAIQNISDEQWDAMFDVHAKAPFRLLRAAAPLLRDAAKREIAEGHPRRRKVVNVSSVSGLYGAATQLAYSAAKASLVGVTRTLAKEWGRYNVNVNCVAFGFIDTRLTAKYDDRPTTIRVGDHTVKVGLDAMTVAMMEQLIPLGRPGTTEEAAGAVYLFCIPESDYVSGQVLVCGGGLLL